MITTRLKGGLGNQMFQYAAGKALALKFNVSLAVDDSFLTVSTKGKYTPRSNRLHELRTDFVCARSQQGFTFSGLLRKFTGLTGSTIVDEKSFDKAGPDSVLDGFWQSERYFSGIRNILLKEFCEAYTNPKLEKVGASIDPKQSVAVHVRRGDYVNLPSAAGFHGFAGLEYYTRAFEYIMGKVPACEFFVFSDDMDWCRTNFSQVENITFVESDSDYHSADLLLMKRCHHNIIANSSYSWWSAWLNENPGKIVIAPSRWFADQKQDSSGIYCEGWVRL